MLNMGIYYMTYILFNENLYGVFSWAINIPLIIALLVTPVLVEKWKGMYKLNLTGYVIGTIGRALVVVAGYLGSVPLMLFIYRHRSLWYGTLAGRYECSDRFLFGIYLSDKAQKSRRNHVLLYLSWH